MHISGDFFVSWLKHFILTYFQLLMIDETSMEVADRLIKK